MLVAFALDRSNTSFALQCYRFGLLFPWSRRPFFLNFRFQDGLDWGVLVASLQKRQCFIPIRRGMLFKHSPCMFSRNLQEHVSRTYGNNAPNLELRFRFSQCFQPSAYKSPPKTEWSSHPTRESGHHKLPCPWFDRFFTLVLKVFLKTLIRRTQATNRTTHDCFAISLHEQLDGRRLWHHPCPHLLSSTMIKTQFQALYRNIQWIRSLHNLLPPLRHPPPTPIWIYLFLQLIISSWIR